MTRTKQPSDRPSNPQFSSGPCSKRPGWSPAALADAYVGRSHRSAEGKARLKAVIEKTKQILRLPPGYEVAIVAGSDTGAFEMAMWNLLGARGVDVFAWEIFGRIWLRDALEHLKLADLRTFEADWGQLPDLSKADFSRDVIFTWNGTTSGVRVPDADWIPENRQGLTFCDATSAVFAQDIDFSKLDVLTFSWQKVLGGEAAHGMLILSPRAFERLETYQPAWPIPKILRLKGPGGVLHDAFEGVTINTPSMLCVEDYADALRWVEDIGGLTALLARADANAAVIYDWVARTPWIDVLATDPKTRSNTSVCLRFADADFSSRSEQDKLAFVQELVDVLDREGAAYDINAYRGAPAGLRIWCGATIEAGDLPILTQWLDWAYDEAKSSNVS